MDLSHFPLHFPIPGWPPSCSLQTYNVQKPGDNRASHAPRESFWFICTLLYGSARLQTGSHTEPNLTRFTGPNPTVSGLPSSSTLMALLTSPLQSCRAITHSSWFLPVMSISCRRDTATVSAFPNQDSTNSPPALLRGEQTASQNRKRLKERRGLAVVPASPA